jgi:hypothetical protein
MRTTVIYTSTAGISVEGKNEKEIREKIREAAKQLREFSCDS